MNFTALPDQVDEHLAQAAGSPRTRSGTCGVDVADQLEPLAVRAAVAEQLAAASSSVLAQVEVDVVELELAGLDLREVENVVDDARAAPRADSRSVSSVVALFGGRARCRAAARSCR